MKINTTIKYFLIGVAVFVVTFLYIDIKPVNAGQGCCSWHGGQDYCDYDVGRWVCNDNTYSPSCGCPIIYKPSCSIKINPSTIIWGNSATLSWSSPNATLVKSSTFGAVGLSGTLNINPVIDTSYNLSVSNIRGDSSCQASIKVNPKIEVKNEVISEPVNLDDKVIQDNDQSRWSSVVVDPGVVGSKDITYSVTYTNNAETKREKVSEAIKIEPKEKIIKVGTMNPISYYYLAIKKAITNHKAISYPIIGLLFLSVLVYLVRKYGLTEYAKKLIKGFYGIRKK